MDNFWADNDLGSEEIAFHRFRHSYSTYMRAAKVPTEVGAALLEHLNNNVTDDVYTDIENPDKVEAVQKYYEYIEDVFNAK